MNKASPILNIYNSDYSNDLFELSSKNIFLMNRIEWWLLKYSDTYKDIQTYLEENGVENYWLEPGNTIYLPTSEDPIIKNVNRFLYLYEALDIISELHRNEPYFKQEMLAYPKVKDELETLKAWVDKSEQLMLDKYVMFLADYLDYIPSTENLKVNVRCSPDLDIFIDPKDFQYTIEFLEIFSKLYWKDRIFPDRILTPENLATFEGGRYKNKNT